MYILGQLPHRNSGSGLHSPLHGGTIAEQRALFIIYGSVMISCAISRLVR